MEKHLLKLPSVSMCKEELDIFDFELTEDEMTRLKQLDENKSMWAEYDDPMIVQYAMEEQ